MKIKKLLLLALVAAIIVALGFAARRIWMAKMAQQRAVEIPAFYNPED